MTLLLAVKSDFMRGLAPIKGWLASVRDEFSDVKVSNVYRVKALPSDRGWLYELTFVVGLPEIRKPSSLDEALAALPADEQFDIKPLLWGEQVILNPRMPIPHPDLHRNLVLLQCAAEVDAELKHPILGQTLGERLNRETRLNPLEFFAQGRHL